MEHEKLEAPKGPRQASSWTSSAKSGIGRAINGGAEVIFTLNSGYITEVYYPREDIACIKDINFVVADGQQFFSHETLHTDSSVTWMAEGVPAYYVANTCINRNYLLEKEIVTDPIRNTLLQKIDFTPHKKSTTVYNLYVLISPRINNQGDDNSGRTGNYKGVDMLFACHGELTIAVASSSGWIKRSVGYAGSSGGWSELEQFKEIRNEYQQANNGNIILCGQVDLSKTSSFMLAVGFGRTEEEAGNRAWSSLLDGFDTAKKLYIHEWKQWLKTLKKNFGRLGRLAGSSAAVLRMSEAKSFPGGIIASLSVPWGSIKGDKDLSGYHVVWPRDLVESSGGFLALESEGDALRIANYLMSTQELDGKWWQNMWLAGDPYWKGIQMDQVALPILLIENCYRRDKIDAARMHRYWPRLKKAASFIMSSGPFSQQDRWEEQAGLTAFTLAAEIAGLLAAAKLADVNGEKAFASYCLDTADYWNSRIESWTYVTETKISKESGVEGYYMRINSTHKPAEDVKEQIINLKNHNSDDGERPLGEIISVDALALVRFGLRAADDPKILNTIVVIDKILRVDTPGGPCWHRYNHDGYGEDEQGNPYTGAGKGRAWPLLTGERGHYEIAAGNMEKAKELLKAMDSFSTNGLLPEQVWDEADVPDKHLYFGRPSGSAMPLAWAHAEYIKLCCSIKEKKVFDMAPYVHKRYVEDKIGSDLSVWRFSWPCLLLERGKTLRIELLANAMIHWTDNNWQTNHEIQTKEAFTGFWFADITLQNEAAKEILFTFFWTASGNWEGINFTVPVKEI